MDQANNQPNPKQVKISKRTSIQNQNIVLKLLLCSVPLLIVTVLLAVILNALIQLRGLSIGLAIIFFFFIIFYTLTKLNYLKIIIILLCILLVWLAYWYLVMNPLAATIAMQDEVGDIGGYESARVYSWVTIDGRVYVLRDLCNDDDCRTVFGGGVLYYDNIGFKRVLCSPMGEKSMNIVEKAMCGGEKSWQDNFMYTEMEVGL